MAIEDQFRRVDDDFKLRDEVLVVLTDADGKGEPLAVVFWRPDATAAHVEESEPDAVEGALSLAKAKASELHRQIVVQIDDLEDWWPHWGTLS
jgi:hypothetical protein